MTQCCLLAVPVDGTVYADIGEYQGECNPEEMIYDSNLVDWEGMVTRHFVPVDYYRQFQPKGDKGPKMYEKAFGAFSHFAFFEYQGGEETFDIWVDKDNCLTGEWLLLMFHEGKFHWFNSEMDAQTIFIWLTSPDIQGLIYEQHRLEGTKFPRSVASKIN